jgi:hypothetical protein
VHLKIAEGIEWAALGGVKSVQIGRQGERLFQEQLTSWLANRRYEIRVHQREGSLPPDVIRIMDVHVVDRRSGEVVLRYEVKTNSGRITEAQMKADKALAQQGKHVYYVRVYTADNSVAINGMPAREYFKTVGRPFFIRNLKGRK